MDPKMNEGTLRSFKMAIRGLGRSNKTIEGIFRWAQEAAKRADRGRKGDRGASFSCFGGSPNPTNFLQMQKYNNCLLENEDAHVFAIILQWIARPEERKTTKNKKS